MLATARSFQLRHNLLVDGVTLCFQLVNAKLTEAVSEGFASVIQSRRKRGIEAIRLGQQPEQPPFRVHRPAIGTAGVGEALERRVAEMMGGTWEVPFGPDFARDVIETSDQWSLPLDSAEQNRLIDQAN